ncbi:MAG: rhomboid family intramembrane serine protease [Pseudomonadota bacterium]
MSDLENDDAQKNVPSEDPENSGFEPPLNIPASVVLLVGACVVIHVALTEYVTQQFYARAILNFAFIPIRFDASVTGQFDLVAMITLVSHSFIHGSWTHLAFNMIWLVAFGSPLAYRLGFIRTFAFWAITATAAALFHLALYWGDTVPLIGASGAVSGFLGAAARFGFRRPPVARTGFLGPLPPPMWALRQRGVLSFLILWMVLNFVTGMGWLGGPNNIAWEAHIGGLVVGFALIGLVDRRQTRSDELA